MFLLCNSISKKDILSKTKIKVKNNKIMLLASLDKTHSWKGLDDILEAVKSYVQNFNKNIELLIVGDGDYKKHYEKIVEKLKIGKYVNFVGAKFGKDKYNLFRKAKILVIFPKTANKAFPTVFLEVCGLV